jgi:hypothetical protein
MHECGNSKRGQAVSFLGIHKSDFLCSVQAISLHYKDCRVQILMESMKSEKVDFKDKKRLFRPKGNSAPEAGVSVPAFSQQLRA